MGNAACSLILTERPASFLRKRLHTATRIDNRPEGREVRGEMAVDVEACMPRTD